MVRSCLCVYNMFMCVRVNTSSLVFACNGLSIIVHSYVYATVKSFTGWTYKYILTCTFFRDKLIVLCNKLLIHTHTHTHTHIVLSISYRPLNLLYTWRKPLKIIRLLLGQCWSDCSPYTWRKPFKITGLVSL